jgi:outer membrane biosynthesis protein TonB
LDPPRLIGSGIAASAVGHLSVAAIILILAEVHPFGAVTAEPMTVDLVSSAELPQAPQREEPTEEENPAPSNTVELSSKPSPSSQPPSAVTPKPTAPPHQQQAQQSMPQQQAQQSTPAPGAKASPAAPAEPPAPSSSASAPGYIPAQPDLSLKYHVMLGLPPEIPVDRPQGSKTGEDFDAPASKTADVASNLVAEFRHRLKTCAKLPLSISASDKVKITLRVLMSTDGRLAAEPILIEASASAKGPALMQSATAALAACQPYTMLPADRYGEWKVLDLTFTPQDFGV